MTTIYTERGRYMGRISVAKTIRTMEPGEEWHINPDQVNMQTVRNCCSEASKGPMLFRSSCPGFSDPCITIKRIK